MKTHESEIIEVYSGTGSVKILKWLVLPGDDVEKDQPLVEVRVDVFLPSLCGIWVDIQFTAPIAGNILHTHGHEDEDLVVPSVLVTYALEQDEPTATDNEGITRQIKEFLRRRAATTVIARKLREGLEEKGNRWSVCLSDSKALKREFEERFGGVAFETLIALIFGDNLREFPDVRCEAVALLREMVDADAISAIVQDPEKPDLLRRRTLSSQR